jgi:ABC-type ATPase with predicted acetyltransferase domain
LLIVKGGYKVAVWHCQHCGFEKDARCKPRNCPECGEKDAFKKKEVEAMAVAKKQPACKRK